MNSKYCTEERKDRGEREREREREKRDKGGRGRRRDGVYLTHLIEVVSCLRRENAPPSPTTQHMQQLSDVGH